MVAQPRRQRDLQRELLHPVPLLVAAPHHGRHLDQSGQGQHPRLFHDSNGAEGRGAKDGDRLSNVYWFKKIYVWFRLRFSSGAACVHDVAAACMQAINRPLCSHSMLYQHAGVFS